MFICRYWPNQRIGYGGADLRSSFVRSQALTQYGNWTTTTCSYLLTSRECPLGWIKHQKALNAHTGLQQCERIHMTGEPQFEIHATLQQSQLIITALKRSLLWLNSKVPSPFTVPAAAATKRIFHVLTIGKLFTPARTNVGEPCDLQIPALYKSSLSLTLATR